MLNPNRLLAPLRTGHSSQATPKFTLLLLVVAVFAVSCTSGTPVTLASSPTTQQPAVSQDVRQSLFPLATTQSRARPARGQVGLDTASDFTGQWQLKFLDVDGRVYRPSAVWQPRLDIPSDPIGWSGDNGCNRFRYTVNLSDTNLIAVYQTTRGCPAVEELAALFMDTLEVAATAIVSDGDLIVEGSRGRLIFVPFGGPEGP